MKTSEIRSLSQTEMSQKMEDFEEELFNLRFQSKVGTLDNPLRLRVLRKDIARIKTILNELSRITKKENEKKGAAETPKEAVK